MRNQYPANSPKLPNLHIAMTTYKVINSRTGETFATYSTHKVAYRHALKLCCIYGPKRYAVKAPSKTAPAELTPA